MSNLLLQLVDEKKVGLDDKISTWLPDLLHADKVTVGQLATMTSGYRDYVPNPKFLKVNDTDVFKVWTPRRSSYTPTSTGRGVRPGHPARTQTAPRSCSRRWRP